MGRYWIADKEEGGAAAGAITVPRFHAYEEKKDDAEDPMADVTFYMDPATTPSVPQNNPDAFSRAKAAWESSDTAGETDAKEPNAPVVLETRILPTDPTKPGFALPVNSAAVLSAPSASPARQPKRKQQQRGTGDRLWEKDPVDLDKLERAKREPWETAESGSWKEFLGLQSHARSWTKGSSHPHSPQTNWN